MMFSLDNVSFCIKDKIILHPLSLEIEKGKFTTFLGHNGCGKSTLVKLLSKQNRPTNGTVYLQSKPIEQTTPKEFAQSVAYLPQHPPVTEGITVKELVEFGRYPWKGVMGRYTAEDHHFVNEAILKVGLDNMKNRFVSTLSGGERQRAWVAMLLAQQSECIVLDEPTSALDVAHQFELLKLIRQLNCELGLTVVTVLHDINMASRFSDTLIALHSGKLLFKGSSTEIMETSVLESVYGVKLGLFEHPLSGQPISFVL